MDDVLILDPTKLICFKQKNLLMKLLQSKIFLGLEIACFTTGMYLNQKKYILDILNELGLSGAKQTQVPLP